MSYIPDYRCTENEEYLSKTDKVWLNGFRYAMTCAKTALEDTIDRLEIVGDEITDEFEFNLDLAERETVCSVFESAKYISDSAHIIDVAVSPYGRSDE